MCHTPKPGDKVPTTKPPVKPGGDDDLKGFPDQ